MDNIFGDIDYEFSDIIKDIERVLKQLVSDKYASGIPVNISIVGASGIITDNKYYLTPHEDTSNVVDSISSFLKEEVEVSARFNKSEKIKASFYAYQHGGSQRKYTRTYDLN